MTADRIGYYRQLAGELLATQWTIHVPGYYLADESARERPCCHWLGGRTVRCTCFASSREGEFDPRDAVRDFMKVDSEEVEEVLDYLAEDLPGLATIRRVVDDEEGEYWALQGCTGGNERRLCLTTICYEDDLDREWAIDTWRTVRHSKDDDE